MFIFIFKFSILFDSFKNKFKNIPGGMSTARFRFDGQQFTPDDTPHKVMFFNLLCSQCCSVF